MSSAATWKNALPRRMYRERRQLKSREHLGLLEKKRDYKRRAKDYHAKENVISTLICI
jgi:U3 small nucleolar RNA-associated protein 11